MEDRIKTGCGGGFGKGELYEAFKNYGYVSAIFVRGGCFDWRMLSPVICISS